MKLFSNVPKGTQIAIFASAAAVTIAVLEAVIFDIKGQSWDMGWSDYTFLGKIAIVTICTSLAYIIWSVIWSKIQEIKRKRKKR